MLWEPGTEEVAMPMAMSAREAARAEAACCRTHMLEKLSMLQERRRERPPMLQEQGAGEPIRPAQAWGETYTYFSCVPPAPSQTKLNIMPCGKRNIFTGPSNLRMETV